MVDAAISLYPGARTGDAGARRGGSHGGDMATGTWQA